MTAVLNRRSQVAKTSFETGPAFQEEKLTEEMPIIIVAINIYKNGEISLLDVVFNILC